MPEFYTIHARRISNAKYPNFYYIYPKINKIPELYMIFVRMPKFYIIIA